MVNKNTPRVIRGGRWGNNAVYCRLSDYHPRSPGLHAIDVGFRLATNNNKRKIKMKTIENLQKCCRDGLLLTFDNYCNKCGTNLHKLRWANYGELGQLMRFKVTNAQYELFDPHHERTEYSPNGDTAVINVSYYDIQKFINWLNETHKLNVKLQKEKLYDAARTNEGRTRFPWGDVEHGETHMNCYESGNGKAVAVDSYPEGANDKGVFNLLGDTWEWCDDEY